MSTFVYARLTNLRDQAQPNTSTATAPPGLGSYVDALAALVPAEVLSVHAVLLTFTTSTANKVTTIEATSTLAWSFYGLIALCVVIYVVGRGNLADRLDWVRAAIPPLAFVAWTMLQRATAFDAINPSLPSEPRTAIGIFVAVILTLVTAALARMADQKAPPAPQPVPPIPQPVPNQ